MDSETVIGIVIWAVCLFGCAVTFFGIGIWAERSKKPVHFWAGTKVDPQKVRDVQGYNHANAVLWKWYSVPYFFSGILGCLTWISDTYMKAGAVILGLACVPGMFILIWRYLRIEKEYILR